MTPKRGEPPGMFHLKSGTRSTAAAEIARAGQLPPAGWREL
jgi:hypothetical protein